MPTIEKEAYILPEEANTHLEAIEAPERRMAIAEHLGRLAMIVTDDSRKLQLEHHQVHKSVEAIGANQTDLTNQLITSIAERAKLASNEIAQENPDPREEAEILWDRILQSEMADIIEAQEAGEDQRVESLIIEHMVSLELAFTKPEKGHILYKKNDERVTQSLMKLASLGLSESVIKASRKAYGLIVISDQDSFGDGNHFRPISHSVAHTFENGMSALEVGLGRKISLDPEETPEQEFSPLAEDIEKLDLAGSAIAIAAREKTSLATRTVEDQELIESLNHHALKQLAKRTSITSPMCRDLFASSIDVICEATPDILSDSTYVADFAELRQRRAVKTHYRINDGSTYILDQQIITLLKRGNVEFAKQLITANPAEVDRPDRLNGEGVLTASVDYDEDKLSDAQKLQLKNQIIEIQAEKAQFISSQLETILTKLALDEETSARLSETVLNAHDPESALASVIAIQKASENDSEPDDIHEIIKLLIESGNGNDNSFLDEVGLASDSLAFTLLSKEFRQLSNYAQINILRQPERTAQIIELSSHPMLEKLLESGIVFDAIKDQVVAEKLKHKLDALDQFKELLTTDQLVKILVDDDAFNFMQRLAESQGEWSFESIPMINQERRMILDVGILTQSPELQENVIKNWKLIPSPETNKAFDLINNLIITDQELELIRCNLLQSEDMVSRCQEFIQVVEETSLFDLIGSNGPAAAFGPMLINTIISSENPLQAARQACDQLLNNDPLWLRCFKISQMGIGDVAKVGFQKGLEIKEIPLSLPIANLSFEQQSEVLVSQQPKRFDEMTNEEKRSVADLDEFNDEQITNMQEVAFTQLLPEYQGVILAQRLFETVTLTREPVERQLASQRNYEYSQTNRWLVAGDLIHATDSTIGLRAILTSGALCGESIGMDAEKDSYPFNLDTVVVSQDVIDKPDYKTKVDALKNRHYGSILIEFRRGPEAIHAGEEFKGGMNEDHRLMIGGLPATEISTILLRGDNPPEFESEVKRIVVESGIYIPVVNSSGELILSIDEYTKMIEDENVLAVQPSVVDGAMKRANSQSGSNEGAEFIVPRGSGHEPEKWYVKFGDDNPDRMWTEILADQIYREVMPAVVPETSPIIVEGRLARASKIVPTDEAVGVTNQARNEAFIMDCLLGNWDAVYNNANIVMSGGHGMRIDTGCSLDYRARGERKADGTFTGIVTELEFGTDDSRLALGMRQKYPGLSDADIEQQVERMRTSLTDDRIDELVDSIRRTLQDRTELKRVIKARRDYIIHEFNTQIPQAA